LPTEGYHHPRSKPRSYFDGSSGHDGQNGNFQKWEIDNIKRKHTRVPRSETRQRSNHHHRRHRRLLVTSGSVSIPRHQGPRDRSRRRRSSSGAPTRRGCRAATSTTSTASSGKAASADEAVLTPDPIPSRTETPRLLGAPPTTTTLPPMTAGAAALRAYGGLGFCSNNYMGCDSMFTQRARIRSPAVTFFTPHI
jgi:hypothetical protein